MKLALIILSIICAFTISMESQQTSSKKQLTQNYETSRLKSALRNKYRSDAGKLRGENNMNNEIHEPWSRNRVWINCKCPARGSEACASNGKLYTNPCVIRKCVKQIFPGIRKVSLKKCKDKPTGGLRYTDFDEDFSWFFDPFASTLEYEWSKRTPAQEPEPQVLYFPIKSPSGYPQQPPGYPQQSPDYPDGPPDYPQQPPDYPDGPPGYPKQPPGYPKQPPGYLQQPPGYPQQPPGYPKQPPGYPKQPQLQQSSGYPNRPPDFSIRPPGYPQQPPGFPNQPPGYPQHPPRPNKILFLSKL